MVGLPFYARDETGRPPQSGLVERGELGWSPSRWTLRRALSGIVYSARSHMRKRSLYPGWLSEYARGETRRFKTRWRHGAG
jgi:hypothetical protein